MTDQAEPVTVPAPEQQIGIAVADTPAGPRLAITVTTLLDAKGAKAYADAIRQAADGMSSTGLVVAGGTMPR